MTVMTPPPDPLRTAALEYMARGWPVFPLQGIRLGACTCGRPTCDRPGKHPRTPHGLDDATVDLQQVQAWWRRSPHVNIGLRTGDGLVVLDVDDDRSLEGLPSTPTVESGKGSHLYLRSEHLVWNRVGLVPGVDVRGERGYVVAPPSRHISGATYRWRVTLGVPLAPLPPWVLAKVAAPRGHALRELQDKGLQQTPSTPAPVIPEGRRRDTLWRLGRRLRLKGWSPESIAKKLHKVNAEQCRPPLDMAEVERTIQHVLSHPDEARYQR